MTGGVVYGYRNIPVYAGTDSSGKPIRSHVVRELHAEEKGGVSVYGLGRFPVTLYKEQWTKLLDMADDNEASLKTKS